MALSLNGSFLYYIMNYNIHPLYFHAAITSGLNKFVNAGKNPMPTKGSSLMMSPK